MAFNPHDHPIELTGYELDMCERVLGQAVEWFQAGVFEREDVAEAAVEYGLALHDYITHPEHPRQWPDQDFSFDDLTDEDYPLDLDPDIPF